MAQLFPVNFGERPVLPQRRIADLLATQSQQPRRIDHPVQGISQLVQAAVAALLQNRAGKAETEEQSGLNTAIINALQAGQTRGPTTTTPLPSPTGDLRGEEAALTNDKTMLELGPGGVQAVEAGQPGGRQAVIDALKASSNARAQQAGIGLDLNRLFDTPELSLDEQVTKARRIAKAKRPSITEDTERAGAIAREKQSVKMEGIRQILQAAGADLLPDPAGIEGTDKTEAGQLEGPAISAPFGPQETASADAQDVARLFSASRRLLLVGETGMANNLLSQARFISDNSTDIKRQQELDKSISADLASELGVEIGTTYREVLGVIPSSPGELAEERSVGTARGRQRVADEEQLGFVDEARTMVSGLLENIEADPGIVGVRGSLRATGQTAFGVLGDLGATALAETARGLAFDNTDLGLDSVTQMFDSPTLSVLDILENSIGLVLARLRTPSGRIPVDVIKRSIKDVQLKGLKSSEQIQNRLKLVLGQLDRRAGKIEKRSGGVEQESAPSSLPRFRIEGGVLTPVEP